MKTISPMIGLVAVVFATVVSVSGQTVTSYTVQKTHFLTQTSSSAPVDDPSAPFGISSKIDGSTLSGLANHSFTPPSASAIQLTYSAGKDEWKSGPTTYGSQALLDATFNNGTYSMGVGSNASIPLSLTGNSYATAIPQVTNGTWSGGNLVIDPNATTVLNFTTFSQFGTGAGSAESFNINSISGPAVNLSQTSVSFTSGVFTSGASFNSFTIHPSDLVAGNTYAVIIDFSLFTAFDSSSISGAVGAAAYDIKTGFTITAIPEPSSGASILGSIAFVAVAIFQAKRKWSVA